MPASSRRLGPIERRPCRLHELAPHDDGRRIRSYAKRGPLFDAKIADRIVVRRNAQPLLNVFRVLMAEGCNPATPIVMRHEGSVMDALRTTVGHAAKLTVDEPADCKRPPRFRDWRPRDMGDDSSPPIAPGDLAAAK
jgi:hypothetical protein